MVRRFYRGDGASLEDILSTSERAELDADCSSSLRRLFEQMKLAGLPARTSRTILGNEYDVREVNGIALELIILESYFEIEDIEISKAENSIVISLCEKQEINRKNLSNIIEGSFMLFYDSRDVLIAKSFVKFQSKPPNAAEIIGQKVPKQRASEEPPFMEARISLLCRYSLFDVHRAVFASVAERRERG